jgi:outer membrane protein assembly factor BamB
VKLVLGPYCDLEWIGGGGMADVYRAREPEMGDRTVAIKIPKTDYDTDRAKRRFEREIAASARLQHENAVRAYHRGDAGGRPYLVMEFVSGRKLSELVRPDSPLSPKRVAKILLGIARGLAHGAQMGVVNRDIKPDNVLLAEPDETPKILDYGLALLAAVDEQVTRSGTLLGTPNYAAPEQARDPHGVTIAADVYSLGCTAVYCLTSRPPFRARDVIEVLRLHAEAPRPSLRPQRPDVSEAFDRLIQSMMAIGPHQRPSPEAVSHALQAMVQELSDETMRPLGQGRGRRIDVECPGCGTVYHLLANSSGKSMRCPNKLCGATFEVPPPPREPPQVVDAEMAGVDDASADGPEVVEAAPAEPAPAVRPPPLPAGLPPSSEREGEPVLEAEIADVPGADVAELPSSAVVQGPPGRQPPSGIDRPDETTSVSSSFAGGVTPVGDSTPRWAAQTVSETSAPSPKPAARRASARKRRRRKRRRRIAWLPVAILVGLVGGVLLLASLVPSDLLFPDAEARWARVMELFEDKKWARVSRELDRFEEDFAESPHVEEIPFFRDMCEAGHDVYSPTGNADRGLARLEQIFRRHRDNPAYAAYCGRLFDALARLVTRFSGAAVDTSQRAFVEQARRAHQLLGTVGQAMSDPGAPERTAALALAIEHAESAVELALARQAADDWLQKAKSPTSEIDPDTVYAEIDRILDEYGMLAGRVGQLSDRLEGSSEEAATFLTDLYTYYNGAGLERRIEQTSLAVRKASGAAQSGLVVAYQAEPGRISFLPQQRDSAPLPPGPEGVGTPPQGTMLAAVWDDAASRVWLWNEWNYRKTLSEPITPAEPTQVFFALARGILYAFAPDGTLLWARRLGIDSHRLPERVDASQPMRIAVSTEDNALVALDEATGRLRWQYRVGQDIVAPLTIVQRTVAPQSPGRHCGLLPTADGEIHALELVLGKPLGRYQVGHPLTVGGAYDRKTGVVFFPADAKRVFAIDPAAVDDPERPACPAVLFTDHASGALRCEPVVVGQYLIISEASQLEHTRVRAFEIHESGLLEPTDEPRKELTLPGWTWFEPHSTPDRITLITDEGQLGVFGLNLDNPNEALYRIVPDWNTDRPAPYRALAVHAEEHLLWILAGGMLEQLAIDVVRQQIRPLWQRSTRSLGVAGFPVHKAQMDRFARRLLLATMLPTGRVFRFTAFDAEKGNRLWQRQLGFNPLGDPLVCEEGVLLLDRSGRNVVIRSDFYRAGGVPLPPGADDDQLMRLDDAPRATHLVVPLAGGTRLAVRKVDLADSAQQDKWIVRQLPQTTLNGRPCICGDFLVVPCTDGQVYRIRWKGEPDGDDGPISFSTRTKHPVELVSLSPEAVLAIDGGRHLRRLDLRNEEGQTRWEQVGSEFRPDGEQTRLAGEPLAFDGRLFVFDTEGTLHCLAADDPGRRLARWTLGLNVTRGPVLRDGRLLAVVDDRRLICLAPDAPPDAEQPLWITEPFAGRLRGMPLLAGDTLLVADNGQQLTGIRLADGQQAWSTRLRVRVGPSATPVPCAEGKMLVPLSDGTLQVMHIPSPEPEETKP